MVLNIKRVKDCSEWLQSVSQDYTSSQTITWYIDQIGFLCNSLAFVNEQMAIAKRELLDKKKYAYEEIFKDGIDLSPSIIKEYINTRCGEQYYNYELCERVSRTIYHTIESLRSILSALKEEMKVTHNNFNS